MDDFEISKHDRFRFDFLKKSRFRISIRFLLFRLWDFSDACPWSMAHVDECYVIRIPYAFGTIEPGTTKYNGIETKKN